MRVRIQHADRGGCGFYRLIWPAETLAGMGLDVATHNQWPEGLRRRQGNGLDHLLSVDVGDADVVVLQRPMEGSVLESIPVMQRQGVAVVVELDDDFTALPRNHPARRGTAGVDRNGERRQFNRRYLRLCCERADLVTCSTPAIGERYAPDHHVVVPNCVPAHYLTIAGADHDGVRVGWTGSTQTHVGDLEAAGDGIARALDGRPFYVVGTGEGVAPALGLDEHRIEAAGWLPIEDYPHAYADLDVAVVPLEDNDFNRAKSWLKGIEAAALGVPFVASPTDPYCELVAMGAGGLARTPDEWRIMVRLLIDNVDARQEIAGRGREVASHWTIEGNAWRWAEAWEQALNIRRQKAAA